MGRKKFFFINYCMLCLCIMFAVFILGGFLKPFLAGYIRMEFWLYMLCLLAFSLVLSFVIWLCGGKWFVLLLLPKYERKHLITQLNFLEHGLTSKYVEKTIDLFNEVSSRDNAEKRKLYNSVSLELASYYSDTYDKDRAYYYLDCVDTDYYVANIEDNNVRTSYVLYGITRLIIECDNGDAERAKITYPIACQVFNQYNKEPKLIAHMDIAVANYNRVMGFPEQAIEMVKKNPKDQELAVEYHDLLARAYADLQQYDKEMEHLLLLQEKTKGEISKTAIQKRIDELREKMQ